MKANYPKYKNLSAEEIELVNNGCGAEWMPEKLKNWFFGWFFHASCGHHDWGYLIGGGEIRRIICDWKFFKALLLDAKEYTNEGGFFLGLYCFLISCIMFLMVRLFGWTSFYYGEPSTKELAFRVVSGKEKIKFWDRIKRFYWV